MIRKTFLIALVLTAALLGFGFGSGFLPRESGRRLAPGAARVAGIHPERNVAITEGKSFVVVLYAQNDADWCERSLRSIFEQDYESFRLVVVDDGSVDGTLDRVREFIVANEQQHRVLVMRNETPCGLSASLYRAASHCGDQEIFVPLLASDWMASSSVLSLWNRAFQNSDVWIAFGRSIGYPSYDLQDPPYFEPKTVAKRGWGEPSSRVFVSHCFYSALFKQISVHALQADYLASLLELSGGRMKNVWEPICFVNETKPWKQIVPSALSRMPLAPLQAFPKQWSSAAQEVDVIVFSRNSPADLFAALDAMQRHVSGIGRTTAVVSADERFVSAYAGVRSAFPEVVFVPHSLKKQPFLDTHAKHVLLVEDSATLIQSIDLRKPAALLEKTGAEAFLFSEAPPSSKAMWLSDGIVAWQPSEEKNWGMALYRTADVCKQLRGKDVGVMKTFLSHDAICLSFYEAQ